MLDLLIRNAYIADGTGNPGYNGDLAVEGGRIADHRPFARSPSGRQRSTPPAKCSAPASSTSTCTRRSRCWPAGTRRACKWASPPSSSAPTAWALPRSRPSCWPTTGATFSASTATLTSAGTGPPWPEYLECLHRQCAQQLSSAKRRTALFAWHAMGWKTGPGQR